MLPRLRLADRIQEGLAGQLDLQAIKENRPQAAVSNPDGNYRLIRVGDAVHSRNIHAAIYDALRLVKEL